MTETWKPVVDMPFYMVSDLGRIKSISRSYSRPHPRNPSMVQTRRVVGKVIIPSRQKNGYLSIRTIRHGSKLIHRAVVESFVYGGHIPNGLIVCHKDGNSSNNKLGNLYAGTYIDNLNDAKKHGTYCLRPNAKLNMESAIYIRGSKLSCKKLAHMFGVCTTTISFVKRSITWKDE